MLILLGIIAIITGPYTMLKLGKSYRNINNITVSFKDAKTSSISINDKIIINSVMKCMDSAIKMNGIICAIGPLQIVKVKNSNNEIKTIELYLDKNSKVAWYRRKEDSITGYKLSEENTRQLKKLILDYKN